MMHPRPIAVLALLLAFALIGCQLHPRPIDAGNELLAPPPTSTLPYHVSNMRVQTISATRFLFASLHTSFRSMPQPAAQAINSLQRLSASKKIRTAGPILLIYHDPTENLDEPFDLDIGIPIGESTPPTLNYQVRQLPGFRCATVIYRGPMKLLPKAYDTLIPAMIAVGLIPSEETRESYLTWKSPDSLNNVVQIEVGIR